MRCLASLALAVLLGSSGWTERAAYAEAADPIAALSSEIEALEHGRADVEKYRAGLEAQSQTEARAIDRLKAEAPGMGRDFRLGQRLASSQERASELDRLSADLRVRDAYVASRRRLLVEECQRALGRPDLSEGRRAELQRLGTRAAAQLVVAASPLEIARPADVDPLAGPGELSERADRIKDDEEKLQREDRRLARRIGSLEERRRLRERAADVDDDLFGEFTVGRRAVRAVTQAPAERSTTASPAAAPFAAGAAAQDSNQAPRTAGGAAPGAGGGAQAAFESASESASATVLRGLVDPSTLSDLRRAEGSADPDLELKALRKARADVAALASQLARREAELRKRAAELRTHK